MRGTELTLPLEMRYKLVSLYSQLLEILANSEGKGVKGVYIVYNSMLVERSISIGDS